MGTGSPGRDTQAKRNRLHSVPETPSRTHSSGGVTGPARRLHQRTACALRLGLLPGEGPDPLQRIAGSQEPRKTADRAQYSNLQLERNLETRVVLFHY